ncbi:MAG: putative lipid II flippase FtsW, partial [Motiliproteus sp.]|nr:putative lipid II flippase FtsW [Motiliproteus sp.]
MNLAITLPKIPISFQQETRPYDPWLLFSAISLILAGFLMITSASMEVAGVRYDSPFYFAIRHAIFIALGFVVAVVGFF